MGEQVVWAVLSPGLYPQKGLHLGFKARCWRLGIPSHCSYDTAVYVTSPGTGAGAGASAPTVPSVPPPGAGLPCIIPRCWPIHVLPRPSALVRTGGPGESGPGARPTPSRQGHSTSGGPLVPPHPDPSMPWWPVCWAWGWQVPGGESSGPGPDQTSWTDGFLFKRIVTKSLPRSCFRKSIEWAD